MIILSCYLLLRKSPTRIRLSLLLRRFVFRMAEASAKRVTGDKPQGTPSRLPLRAHFQRDVWVRGSIRLIILRSLLTAG